MWYIRVLPARTEVPHEQPVRKMRALDLAVCPSLTMLGLDQVPVGPRCIGIGYDNVTFDNATVLKLHPTHRSRVDKDFIDLGVALDGAALTLDE